MGRWFLEPVDGHWPFKPLAESFFVHPEGQPYEREANSTKNLTVGGHKLLQLQRAGLLIMPAFTSLVLGL